LDGFETEGWGGEALPNGLYYLKVTSNGGKVIEKLLLHR
jgi:hypothetical protein